MNTQNEINTDSHIQYYSFREYYKALLLIYKSIPVLGKNKKEHYISEQFIERIMLAVTEVNGCAVCSYAHTKMALKQGVSSDEIEGFLSGNDAYISPDEAKAILFAQHYASEKGEYDKNAFRTVLDEYGQQKASVILAAIRMIMVGNISGIPLSAFSSRLKGKPYTHSSVAYELGMILSTLVLLPVSFIHSLFIIGKKELR